MKSILSLMILLSSAHSFALPTVYPKALVEVENPTNSNLIADDQDPSLFYVMPPTTGQSKVNKLHSLTANISFCKEMINLKGYSANMTAQMNMVETRRSEKEAEIQKLEDELARIREEEARAVVTPIIEELMRLEEAIDSYNEKIAELLVNIQECRSNCQTLKIEYQNINRLRKQATQEKQNLVKKHQSETRRYLIGQERINAQEDRIRRVADQINELSDRFKKMKATFDSMFEDLGQLEGARASVHFKSQWDENIEMLKQHNPRLQFQKIETRNARLFTSADGLDKLPSIGAIIRYEAGIGTNENGTLMLEAYPESFSGNIVLSIFGTCPLIYPEDFELTNGTAPTIEDMNFAVTASYEYPSVFTTKAEVTYNLYKMYERIQNYSSRGGGFFRTRRSKTSVEERNIFKDSFQVEWKDHIGMPEDVKADMEREMRNNIFIRLAQMGLPAVINTGALQMPPIPESGAIVLADGLKNEICGSSNNWCKGIALGIRVFETIFGSAKASAYYKSTQDVSIKENWTNTQIHWRPWVSSYH